MTPTQEFGKLATAIHNVKMQGESDLITGIQVAQVGFPCYNPTEQRFCIQLST